MARNDDELAQTHCTGSVFEAGGDRGFQYHRGAAHQQHCAEDAACGRD